MLSLPLPIVVVLFLGFFLLRLFLDDRPWTIQRRSFAALIVLCMVHGTVTALVWGYGMVSLRLALPVLASVLPVLTWLSFWTLSQRRATLPTAQLGLRLLPTVAVVLFAVIFPPAIDVVIIAQFVVHGVALWRMADAGPDRFQQARLSRSMSAMRAARLAAWLLLLNALVDLSIIVDFNVTGGQNVLGILSALSVLILLMLGYVAVTGNDASDDEDEDEPETAAADVVTPPVESDAEITDVVARVDGLLRDQRLYADPNLTLARIARKAGLPARDISTAINRHHGMNVSQYVNGFRLDEACRLLATTDDSITNIHMDAGFQTKSNFNREFRRQYGCSPSEWRIERKTRAERPA